MTLAYHPTPMPAIEEESEHQALRSVYLRIIEQGLFEFAFQPIRNLDDGAVEGFEALCRFSGKPYRPPNEWFDGAETVGLGAVLEAAVIRRALEHLPNVPEAAYLSMNASPKAIESGRIAEALVSAQADRLVLEVTEHSDATDETRFLEQLSRIRAGGIRLAMDDVGAGVAGLQQLVRLNPDIIKLDSSLTSQINRDPIRRSVASAMLGFAQETGARVVAEGIETASELATLKELGVQAGQGYYLGRPAAADRDRHSMAMKLEPLPEVDAPPLFHEFDRAAKESGAGGPAETSGTADVSDLLKTTLDHMDQGILVVDGNLDVPILSKRATQLIDLPAAFAANPPPFRDILAHQVKVGAISREYMESSINRYILDKSQMNQAHNYTRKTKSGRWLDVRTTPLPAGGFVRTFTDQTQRHRAEELRKQSDNAYRALFENAAVGIYKCDMEARPLRINPTLVAMHGYSCEADMFQALDSDGTDWYIEEGRQKRFRNQLKTTGRVTDFVSEMYRHLTRERFWVSESAWLTYDTDGNVTGYEGMVVDVSERKRANDLVKHAAEHDHLTQLRNRLIFHRELARLAQDKAPFALMYLDLDKFKPVNDTHGHEAGDQLLALVAKRLQSSLRPDSEVFRIGGDEFAVLLAGEDHARRDTIARRMIEAIEAPMGVDGRTIRISLSIGMANRDAEVDGPEALLAAADAALYRAKKGGGGTFCE